jgi:hypothetical protein
MDLLNPEQESISKDMQATRHDLAFGKDRDRPNSASKLLNLRSKNAARLIRLQSIVTHSATDHSQSSRLDQAS